jgi:hypothetical protein
MAFFLEALRLCPRPLPFPCLWGPHSLIAGALGHSPLPLGCSAGLAVPPFEVFGDFADARARVSPGLGLAPALLLGCVSPLALSIWSLYQPHLLTFSPLLEDLCSAGPLPTGVWEAPARLGYVYNISPCSAGSFCACGCCLVLSWGLCLPQAVMSSVPGGRHDAASSTLWGGDHIRHWEFHCLW